MNPRQIYDRRYSILAKQAILESRDYIEKNEQTICSVVA